MATASRCDAAFRDVEAAKKYTVGHCRACVNVQSGDVRNEYILIYKLNNTSVNQVGIPDYNLIDIHVKRGSHPAGAMSIRCTQRKCHVHWAWNFRSRPVQRFTASHALLGVD